ncbi:PEP-CTERM sorting domain-containing protein [Merismopedia glauca]|uniref:PEP-CTERM sorting domain-containing protein n=1 Tax=Merismopedia glauca CCAP 1448/3 TaxID=1296344 RepID=A0A2T1C4R2_9CYAN|nr:PEP-CTERM sorting domain-containing protein [Merismopedia glauca]PSB03265.1 hypothetical protein C7B64_09205 [Merismopedia glauca CCAP 1448/3]
MGGVALICAATVLPAQAFTIDTRPGNGLIGAFMGEYDPYRGNTVGQTFIATNDNILNEFSFVLGNTGVPGGVDLGNVNFRAFVAAFDNTTNTIAGSILFESETKSTQISDNLENFSFEGLSLALTPGQEYVVFLSTLKDLDGIVDIVSVPSASNFTDGYEDGGGRIVQSGATSFSDLLTSPFSTDNAKGGDMVWTASFSSSSAVPEPTTILGTLAFGSLGAGSWLKRPQKGEKA